ncbi:MAG: 50S ribosomal protein L18 [Acidobacteriota bacterium]
MDRSILRRYRRGRVHLRIRKKVLGTPERPRLAVYRSSKHFYAQAIDDLHGQTLAAASTLQKEFADQLKIEPVPMPEKVEAKVEEKKKAPDAGAETKKKKGKPEKPVEKVDDSVPKVHNGRAVLVARQLGKYMAEQMKAKGITRAVFDRGGFLYHGRVRAFADGAREAGLSF